MSIIIHIARPSAKYILPVVEATVRAHYPPPQYAVRLCDCQQHDPYLKPVLVLLQHQSESIVNDVTFAKHQFCPQVETFKNVYCNICCNKITEGYTCVQPAHSKIHLGKYYSGFHVCVQCKMKIDDKLPLAQGVPVPDLKKRCI